MVKSFRAMLVRVEEVDEGGIWEGGRGKEKVAALIDLWDAMPVMAEVSWIVSCPNRADRVSGRDITGHFALPESPTSSATTSDPWSTHLCHYIRHPAYHIYHQTFPVQPYIPSSRAVYRPHLCSVDIRAHRDKMPRDDSLDIDARDYIPPISHTVDLAIACIAIIPGTACRY